MNNEWTTLKVKKTTRALLDRLFDHHEVTYDQMVESLAKRRK